MTKTRELFTWSISEGSHDDVSDRGGDDDTEGEGELFIVEISVFGMIQSGTGRAEDEYRMRKGEGDWGRPGDDANLVFMAPPGATTVVSCELNGEHNKDSIACCVPAQEKHRRQAA